MSLARPTGEGRVTLDWRPRPAIDSGDLVRTVHYVQPTSGYALREFHRPMTGRLIRLALQSRRRLIRDALSAYFDNLPEFDVVGQTAGLSALPELCALRRPDVAVAEVGRLTTESVEQLRGLRSAAPDTEIVLSYASASPPALDAAAAPGVTAPVP